MNHDFTIYDVLTLLDKVLFALANIPNQPIEDGRGKTTGKLAVEIKELLEGCEDETNTEQ